MTTQIGLSPTPGWLAYQPPYRATCLWQYDSYQGAWETSCGQLFIMLDGTPRENEFRFCPFCGKTLVESTDGARLLRLVTNA